MLIKATEYGSGKRFTDATTIPDTEISYSYRTLAAMVNLEPWAAAFHHALNLMHENNGHGEISIKVVDGQVKHVDVLNKNKY